MEPLRQVEIQLGHMCNNRCVFCVSGQRTSRGEAGVVPAESVLVRIQEAYDNGHRKLTLLGGEPTLQPGFLTVVRRAVDLGFEEIVIFTNGVKTASAGFVDEVLATGGNFIWRISIQGGDEETHVRTTGKPNSFRRIRQTLLNLRARDQRITVNMCVVSGNSASVPGLASLCAEFGVEQLHLDLVRPLDAGDRTEAEMSAMIPDLRALQTPFTELAREVRRLCPDLDLNFGNLPFCVAPQLIPWIHHDGEHTETVTIDRKDELSKPFNKYLIKRRDKAHIPSCEDCLMRDECRGIYGKYLEVHGGDALVPITAGVLRGVDPGRDMFVRHLRPLARSLRQSAGKGLRVMTAERGLGQGSALVVELRADHAMLRVELRAEPGDARHQDFGVHLVAHRGQTDALVTHLMELLPEPIVPLSPIGLKQRSVSGRLSRLSQAAPFGVLRWKRTTRTAHGVELLLEAPGGESALVRLDEEQGRARGGYSVQGDTPELRGGLGELFAAFPSRPMSSPTL